MWSFILKFKRPLEAVIVVINFAVTGRPEVLSVAGVVLEFDGRALCKSFRVCGGVSMFECFLEGEGNVHLCLFSLSS